MKSLFILVYLVVLVSVADGFLVTVFFPGLSVIQRTVILVAIFAMNSGYAAIVYWCARAAIDEAKERPPVAG